MNNQPTLQELLQRDADKIKEIKRARQGAKIEPEWLLLAEFGLYFGWQAVTDVRNNKLSFVEMNKLLAAARRMEAMNRYNRVIDHYAAISAPHDKGKALKQTLKGIKEIWNE